MSDFIWLNPFTPYTEPEPILREVFTGWKEGDGIFSYLADATTLPWANEASVDNSVLDISYFGNHSGSKFCAPLVKVLLEEGEVPAASRETIAKIIVSKYFRNWKALWDTNVAVYDPLNNYDITEERELTATRDETKETDGTLKRTGTDTLAHGRIESTDYSDSESETVEYGKIDTTTHGKQTSDALLHGENETITHGKTVTDTLQHGKTETTTHGKTTNDNTFRFGFNAGDTTPAPADREVIGESGTTAVATTGTDTDTSRESGTTQTAHSGTDTRTIGESGTTRVSESGEDATTVSKSGDRTITNSGSDTQTKNLQDKNDVTETIDHDATEDETTHRYGNIGVTTTQKLIQEERELWLWNYFEQVFQDLDRELALAFHDPCRV